MNFINLIALIVAINSIECLETDESDQVLYKRVMAIASPKQSKAINVVYDDSNIVSFNQTNLKQSKKLTDDSYKMDIFIFFHGIPASESTIEDCYTSKSIECMRYRDNSIDTTVPDYDSINHFTNILA